MKKLIRIFIVLILGILFSLGTLDKGGEFAGDEDFPSTLGMSVTVQEYSNL